MELSSWPAQVAAGQLCLGPEGSHRLPVKLADLDQQQYPRAPEPSWPAPCQAGFLRLCWPAATELALELLHGHGCQSQRDFAASLTVHAKLAAKSRWKRTHRSCRTGVPGAQVQDGCTPAPWDTYALGYANNGLRTTSLGSSIKALFLTSPGSTGFLSSVKPLLSHDCMYSPCSAWCSRAPCSTVGSPLHTGLSRSIDIEFFTKKQ